MSGQNMIGVIGAFPLITYAQKDLLRTTKNLTNKTLDSEKEPCFSGPEQVFLGNPLIIITFPMSIFLFHF